MNYRELRAQLAALEAALTAVRAAGDILSDARIDPSTPSGTTVRGRPSLSTGRGSKGRRRATSKQLK